MKLLTLPVLAAASLPGGEGWKQVGELGLALAFSSLIGLEREMRQKSAGMRTYTLVGVGAALFMLISKYGFMDILTTGRIVLDPSRVAAQIVTGVGFLGGGIIFIRQDAVTGLTTAAGVWLTAGIGAASGAGLPIIAALATVIYFLVTLGFPFLVRKVPRSPWSESVVQVQYPDGQGMLRQLLQVVTSRGFGIDHISTKLMGPAGVEVRLRLHGKGSLNDLASDLSNIEGVTAVVADDAGLADG